jgi:hypothetical protein
VCALANAPVDYRNKLVTTNVSVAPVLLFTVWLAAMALLFWYFERDSVVAGNNNLVRFSAHNMPAAPVVHAVSIMYFLDDTCPCERSAQRQITALQSRYGLGLRQFAVTETGAAIAGLPAAVKILDAVAAAPWRAQVPAFPAAAMWDERGRLIYFGPLAGSSGCGSANTYLEANLDRHARGLKPVVVPADMAGCLCPIKNFSMPQ